MKTILLILTICLACFFSLAQTTTTITYLKVADKADYELYKKYCNDTIVIDIWQYGKATIANFKTPGVNFEMYKALAVGYTDKLLKDTVWFKVWKYGNKVASRTYGTNDYAIQRIVKAKVLRRIYSIDDYYKSRNKLFYK